MDRVLGFNGDFDQGAGARTAGRDLAATIVSGLGKRGWTLRGPTDQGYAWTIDARRNRGSAALRVQFSGAEGRNWQVEVDRRRSLRRRRSREAFAAACADVQAILEADARASSVRWIDA